MHLLKVHGLIVFGPYTKVCNHHLELILKHFHLPEETLYSLVVTAQFLLPPNSGNN